MFMAVVGLLAEDGYLTKSNVETGEVSLSSNPTRTRDSIGWLTEKIPHTI
jgi:hypothetical protein